MIAATEQPRRPVGTRLLVAFAAEHGIAPEAALAGTGLVAAELHDPDTVLDPAQELLAFGTVVRRLGDAPGLGSALGRRFSLANHGDLGFALMTCATAREALRVALRFLGASDALLRVTAHEDGGDVVLDLDATGLPPALVPFATERDVAAITALVEQLLPGAPLGVTLALEPARVAAVAAASPAHAVGPGPVTTLRIRGADLDRPMPNADPATARTFERRLEDRQRRAAPAGTLAPRVRAVLQDALPHRASGPEVAAALHVAPRTLRRRLEAEGTSFQALTDATLSDLAGDLLRQDLPVTDVAARLGYAEIASFTRAFRRWTGSTPRAWARAASTGLGQPGTAHGPQD